MADILQFSRDTKLFVEKNGVYWEMPVLNGFSFSQATNATEITLQEMSDTAGNSRRARQMFTDSYAPAEWSFATYMRPFASVNGTVDGWEDSGSPDNHHAVEEVMWANFISANTFTPSATTTASSWAEGVTHSTTNVVFDLLSSNKSELGTFNLYFVLGGCGATIPYNYSTADGQTVYRVQNCVANTASIDFEIDGIATINWSGFGSIIDDVGTLDLTTQTLISEGVESTNNFIRNRLTSLAVANAMGGNFNATYDVVLTGGNITLENNISYITPETLCTVNQPIGHVTGTRSVGGNFTAYLNSDGTSTAELFDDIIGSTQDIRNVFDLTFAIGGSGTPRVEIQMPRCHLEIPNHSIDDVIAVDTTFHALPTTIDVADEATITYTGA